MAQTFMQFKRNRHLSLSNIGWPSRMHRPNKICEEEAFIKISP